MISAGMKMSTPNEVLVIPDSGVKELQHVVIQSKSRGAQFVFIAHPDEADEMHRNY
jgi:hypothetical protein